MRKTYSRPETSLRAFTRSAKENANNLPFFPQSRKAWRCSLIQLDRE